MTGNSRILSSMPYLLAFPQLFQFLEEYNVQWKIMNKMKEFKRCSYTFKVNVTAGKLHKYQGIHALNIQL